MSDKNNIIATEKSTQGLEKLLQREEGQFLEFKSCYERPGGKGPRLRPSKEVADDVAVVLSAMANADGGTLVIGVEDDKTITGVGYDRESALLKILRAPQNRVNPPLNPRVEKCWVDGKLILIFEIDWSPEVHQITDGRYLLRVVDKNIPFAAEQIHLIKHAKQKGLYERQFVVGASLSDLDQTLIHQLTRRLDPEHSIQDLLTKYRLVEEHNGQLKITRAALLLFASDPLKWHANAGIDFVKYGGKERQYGARFNVTKRERLEYPIARLILKAYRLIKAHIPERVVLHDLFFQEKYEYPTFAWQEAIVNAVAHRDYSLTGVSVEFWMFDDHLEIRSPGAPPEPVTIEQLSNRQRVHFSRNPTIVRVLTDLGFMRELGEGIPRMFEEMSNQGLKPPEFCMEGFMFTVILRNELILDEKVLEWLEKFKHISLNMNQKRVLAYAKTHNLRFNSAEYQKVAEVNRDLAYREISDLLTYGIVKPIHPRARTYMVIEPQEEPGNPVDLMAKKLVPVLKAKGVVTNSDLRDLMQVSRPEATRRLAALVNEGYLVLKGKKYIAGPKIIPLIKKDI